MAPVEEEKKDHAKTVENLLKEWESLNDVFDKLEVGNIFSATVSAKVDLRCL